MMMPPIFLPHVDPISEMQNHKISVRILYSTLILPQLAEVGEKDYKGALENF